MSLKLFYDIASQSMPVCSQLVWNAFFWLCRNGRGMKIFDDDAVWENNHDVDDADNLLLVIYKIILPKDDQPLC